MSWLRINLIAYLNENVHSADYPVGELVDDIIDIFEQAKEYDKQGESN